MHCTRDVDYEEAQQDLSRFWSLGAKEFSKKIVKQKLREFWIISAEHALDSRVSRPAAVGLLPHRIWSFPKGLQERRGAQAGNRPCCCADSVDAELPERKKPL